MQLNLLKIDNCSDQDTQDLEEYIRQLYTYIKKQLQFTVNPTIRLVDDAENGANPLGATGHYEPETKTITVFITDRHTKDILRSICHELAHHNQNCNGRISREGDMAEGYAQKDEHLRTLEKEAYEASILLRDWEDEMKTDNGQLYESLDNYREKRRQLITESIYEKFGFSTEFLKEARPRPGPRITTTQELSALPAIAGGANPADQEANAKVGEVIIKHIASIEGMLNEFTATLTQQERNGRIDQYLKKRITVPLISHPHEIMKNAPGGVKDIIGTLLTTYYHAIGTLLDHLNTQLNDPLTSSTTRVVDKISKRKQVWGENSLRAWRDLELPILLTVLKLAYFLMKVDPAKYKHVPVHYRPANAKAKSVGDSNPSLKGFQMALEKIKRLQSAVFAEEQMQPEEQPVTPGKVAVSDDTLKNISETRKNTLNTLRLLESLTKKDK